jgi:RNA polymerase sigma factor (sigma-70 family)
MKNKNRGEDPLLLATIPNGKAINEENEAFFKRLVAGDETARAEMIKANMPFVVRIVNDYLKDNPLNGNYRDDLIAAGFLRLVAVVNKITEITEIKNENLTEYIRKAILHEIDSALEKEQCVRVPRTSRARAKKNGKPIIDRKVKPIRCLIDEAEAEYGIVEVEDQKSDHRYRAIDMHDLIDSCCEDRVDRIIVKMREDHYTFDEIAKAAGVPAWRIKERLKAIEEKVMKKYKT